MTFDWGILDWLARATQKYQGQISSFDRDSTQSYGQDINRWLGENTPVPFLDSYPCLRVSLHLWVQLVHRVCRSAPSGLLSRLPQRALPLWWPQSLFSWAFGGAKTKDLRVNWLGGFSSPASGDLGSPVPGGWAGTISDCPSGTGRSTVSWNGGRPSWESTAASTR